MTQARHTENPRSTHHSRRLRRWRRLARRIVLPLSTVGLVAVLALTAHARLGGEPASAQQPFIWGGGTVFIAGSSSEEIYTDCLITPDAGERRRVSVPSADGGVAVDHWFPGEARIACGRSVSVTTGWQSTLYPLAFQQSLVFGLAAMAIGAWWFGRSRKM
ncbi:hypothetical protein [Stackebrandtia soli]|uniref:hypothetical protein n=1 Tax=Stackebrandtia soli TaxID=1892856 RepID=UPI0039EC5729